MTKQLEFREGDMCKIIEIEMTDGLSQYKNELNGQKVRFKHLGGIKENGFMICVVTLPENIENKKTLFHKNEPLYFTGVKLEKTN